MYLPAMRTMNRNFSSVLKKIIGKARQCSCNKDRAYKGASAPIKYIA